MRSHRREQRLAAVILFALIGGALIGCSSEQPAGPNPNSGAKPSGQGAVVSEDATTSEAAYVAEPFDVEEGFTALALADFESFGTEDATWVATADGLKCSGKPRGYLYSKQSHKNFTLRLDYRFPRPFNLQDETKFKGNTGFLVYVTGEHKLWPICLEVQGKHVQIAAIKENGGAAPVKVEEDDAARQQARKPVGEWNSLDITSKDGAITVALNGKLISQSQAGELQEGAIGIQAEDHPFQIRRLRIKPEENP